MKGKVFLRYLMRSCVGKIVAIFNLLAAVPLTALDGENFLNHPLFSQFPSFPGLTGPDTEEEIFEWIDLFEAVSPASDQFVRREIGAGNGRWRIRGALAAHTRQIPCYVVFVEAEPSRSQEIIPQELNKQGIAQEEYQIVDVALGEKEGSCFFYVSREGQTLDNWLGQCVVPQEDTIMRYLASSYHGHPLVETSYGYLATEVQQKKLSAILQNLQPPVIDLWDLGIRGKEYVVIKEAISLLNDRVKCLHIGTHSHKIEEKLRALLPGQGEELVRDYPIGQVNRTKYGQIAFMAQSPLPVRIYYG